MSPRDAIDKQIEALQQRLDSCRDPHAFARLTAILRQVKAEKSVLPLNVGSPA